MLEKNGNYKVIRTNKRPVEFKFTDLKEVIDWLYDNEYRKGNLELFVDNKPLCGGSHDAYAYAIRQYIMQNYVEINNQ